MFARSKLNSTESKICEALVKNEISHEDFMTIINEERSYQELKESIRMINSQKSDTEKINLIGEGKKIGIDEAIKHKIQWFISFLIKSLQLVVLKIELHKIGNWLKKFTSQLLKHSKKKSLFIIWRQYLGCWSCRCAINK